MINYFDAIKIAKEDDQSQKVIDAWDVGDYWVFSLAPSDFPEDQTYDTGTIFTAVRKRDGQLGLYDITVNPEEFLNAKRMN